MKKYTLFVFMMISILSNAQTTCGGSEEDLLEDVNAVTKCSIKPKQRELSVSISANRTRYLRKRKSSKSVSKADVKKFKATKALVSMNNSMAMSEVRKAKKITDVESSPMFAKCNGVKGKESIKCFETEMINHISNNLEYPSEAVKDNIQGEVWVRFVIDVNGKVKNLKTLVTTKNGEVLDMEAQRVISLMPKLQPAILNGKPVAVRYGFPVNFSLED